MKFIRLPAGILLAVFLPGRQSLRVRFFCCFNPVGQAAPPTPRGRWRGHSNETIFCFDYLSRTPADQVAIMAESLLDQSRKGTAIDNFTGMCAGVRGSPSRTRTYDLAVNSRVLYQLSYRGMPSPPIP